MHELTEKLFGYCERWIAVSTKENMDKIITSWLEEKCQTMFESTYMVLWNDKLKEHFGLSKKACKCGACDGSEAENLRWKYCPKCGEPLSEM